MNISVLIVKGQRVIKLFLYRIMAQKQCIRMRYLVKNAKLVSVIHRTIVKHCPYLKPLTCLLNRLNDPYFDCNSLLAYSFMD